MTPRVRIEYPYSSVEATLLAQTYLVPRERVSQPIADAIVRLSVLARWYPALLRKSYG